MEKKWKKVGKNCLLLSDAENVKNCKCNCKKKN